MAPMQATIVSANIFASLEDLLGVVEAQVNEPLRVVYTPCEISQDTNTEEVRGFLIQKYGEIDVFDTGSPATRVWVLGEEDTEGAEDTLCEMLLNGNEQAVKHDYLIITLVGFEWGVPENHTCTANRFSDGNYDMEVRLYKYVNNQ